MFHFQDTNSDERDVVISGSGVVTGFGMAMDDLWKGLIRNQSAVRRLNADEVDHRNELAEFLRRDPSAAVVNFEAVRDSLQAKVASDPEGRATVDLFDHDLVNAMALHATSDALHDAGLTHEEVRRLNVGCVVGTSKPSLRATEDWHRAMKQCRVGSAVDVRVFEDGFLSDSCQRACSGFIAAQGPSFCPVAACATGLLAVLQGAMLVRSGIVDVCVAGSADASARSSAMAAFHRLGVLSRHSDPATSCRPFDVSRDGFQIGEGAGILILESVDHAEARGQSSAARLTHGACVTDSTGLTQIDPSGNCVAAVLHSMRANEHTDVCSLHGTGTIPNDQCEATGLQSHFGKNVPPCFGIKGATGHLLGAAGSVELAVSVKAMLEGRRLPTVNFSQSDPACRLPISSRLSSDASQHSLTKLSLGFGGHVVGCRVQVIE